MDRPSSLRNVARWLLAAAVALCAIGTLDPAPILDRLIGPWDKVAHFMAFYGLTLLLFSAFPGRRRLDLMLLAILAGAAIEAVQSVTGRDGELSDLLADAAGAFAVLFPVYLEWAGKPLRSERRQGAGATQPAETQPV